VADFITLLPAGTGTGVTGTTHDTGDIRDQATFQIIAGAGVTASAVTFQGSDDAVNWIPLPLNSVTAVTGAPAAAPQPLGPAAAGSFFYTLVPGAGVWRYFRAVTGTVTGGTLSAAVAYGKT
jgi:hypothetical protein